MSLVARSNFLSCGFRARVGNEREARIRQSLPRLCPLPSCRRFRNFRLLSRIKIVENHGVIQENGAAQRPGMFLNFVKNL